MEVSALKFYSVATVAANKELSSTTVECTPHEDAPMTNGEITDNTTNYTAAAKKSDGSAYQVSVANTSTVKAEWLPIGSSNRKSPPDVRRGETVILYRFADSDKFYWSTLKDDSKLRKLETVIYAFSATTDESADSTGDTTYFFQVSTHQKLIHLHTTKKNGEPFAYDIQLNTSEGFFVIQDDAGNSFQLDSQNRRMQIFNKDGAKFDMNQKDLTITVPGAYAVKAGQSITMSAPKVSEGA